MKNKFILIGIFLWLFYFISYPQDAFAASCAGILLWFEQILPALLPYSILSNIILSSGLFSSAENMTSSPSSATESNSTYINRSFRMPIRPAELFVILCGLAFGFPIGSRLAADLCAKGIISRDRAQLLAAFTNNMSPAFVSNYVLTYSLNRADLRLQTYLILYGVPLVFGILGLLHNSHRNHSSSGNTSNSSGNTSRNRPGNYSNSTSSCSNRPSSSGNRKPASRFHIDMQIIDAGITQSFETLIRLCGYIVIFSILTHIILQFPVAGENVSILLTGILEVTNGISTLPASGLPERVRYLLALGFLSFGGISGIAQTGSMIKQADLSLRSYCRTKLLLSALTLTVTVLYVFLSGAAFA